MISVQVDVARRRRKRYPFVQLESFETVGIHEAGWSFQKIVRHAERDSAVAPPCTQQ